MSKPHSEKTTHEAGASALFERALAASLAQHHEEAVDTLVQVLQREPGHARARHLLGAEYAQAGKIAEAIVEMAVALELEPGMALARFQLGLLLLTSGKPEPAAAVWAPLDTLGNEHVLNLFKNGMLLMAQGNFAAARAALTSAQAENTELPVLNGDLAAALRALDQAEHPSGAAPTEPEKQAEQVQDAATGDADETDASHILVSTYAGSTSTH